MSKLCCKVSFSGFKVFSRRRAVSKVLTIDNTFSRFVVEVDILDPLDVTAFDCFVSEDVLFLDS